MGEGAYTPAPIIPTMYRWISTSKPITPPEDISEEGRDSRKMVISFSIPVSVLPQSVTPQNGSEEGTPMEIDSEGGKPAKTSPVVPSPSVPAETPCCDVAGCQARRKYRWVKDWQRGACGMEHLKLLETQLGTAS